MNHLKIATWNINGLLPKLREVELFISHNKIDILLVSETHLNDQKCVKLKGYNVYYANHPDGTCHAGSAVIIKENIKHHIHSSTRYDYLQASAITIEDWQGPLQVAAVYLPPKHTLKEEVFSSYFQTLGVRFIIGGDWNAKHTTWGSRVTNTRGRELIKSITIHKLQAISTGEPTIWPTDPRKQPDLIDFFISRGISQLYLKVESSLDGTSDHSPVICTLSTSLILREERSVLYNNKTDWHSFYEFIDAHINLRMTLKTEGQLDEATLYFTNLLQEAAWRATPSKQQSTCTKDYCAAIKKKIAEKRKLRRQWHTSRNPRDKTALNNAQKHLKEYLEEAENKTLQNRLETLSHHYKDDYSLWKFTKTFNRPKDFIPPLKKEDGSWAKQDKEKAELYATHLYEVFKPNASDEDISYQNQDINEVINSDQQLSLPLKPVTTQEVKKEISNLKNKKAPGFDLITAEILKQLPKKAIVFITILYNACLRLQYFPAIWKVSIINMIKKPGKPPHEVSSYRPISLLSILSKILEKIILKRISPILVEQNTIPNHQFGFRAQHSTIEQVHRIAQKIRQTLERKQYCSAVFLDIQQAFDRVWHDGLLYKLKKALPNSAFMIIKSYLHERLFQVKCGESYSSFYEIRAGVPQGSVLAPVLYTIFTADLPQSENILTATYADDTAILASSDCPTTASRTLQTHLDKINHWLKTWKIRASAPKSNHITFTLRREDCPPVIFDGAILPHQVSVKYLGMHLDRRLTWKDHIKSKRDQSNNKIRELYWLIGRESRLSLENKLLVYKAVIKPIWTYGIQLWGSASHSNIEILQRFQNAALKTIANAPWFTRNTEIHEYLEMETIHNEIKNYCQKYRERLEHHTNVLAVNLTNTKDCTHRLKRSRLAHM